MSQQTTVDKTASHCNTVVDSSVAKVPPNIVLNNCPDVHIGPKYVHNNNITINTEKDNNSDTTDFTEKPLYFFVRKCLKIPIRIRLKIIFYGTTFLFITLITVATILLMKENPPKDSASRPAENNDDYPIEKKFISRDSWGAAPPCEELPNPLPAQRVLFIHTVSSRTCNSLEACSALVLDMQDMHRDDCRPDPADALGDIMYNFIIGSDGHIFVGRGWDLIGAHTHGSNNGSIGVAFIGDFRRDKPTQKMIDSAKVLLELGVERSKLRKDYQLYGQCQRHSGFPYSPGVNIMEDIQYFPHWNKTDYQNCAGFTPNEGLMTEV